MTYAILFIYIAISIINFYLARRMLKSKTNKLKKLLVFLSVISIVYLFVFLKTLYLLTVKLFKNYFLYIVVVVGSFFLVKDIIKRIKNYRLKKFKGLVK